MLIGCAASMAQVSSQGDLTIRRATDEALRKIYGSTRPAVFLLARSGLPGSNDLRNVEITGSYAEGALNRIVVSGWNNQGQYGAEYWVQAGELAMMYENFAFFNDAAPAGSWRNFKGFAGWERRIYIQHGELGYVEATGRGAPEITGASLIARFTELRAMVERRRSLTPPAAR